MKSYVKTYFNWSDKCPSMRVRLPHQPHQLHLRFHFRPKTKPKTTMGDGDLSRTEQLAAWSAHLQFAHALPKCSVLSRHSGNGLRQFACSRFWHPLQTVAAATPRDWIKIALMYEGRESATRWGMTIPLFIITFWPAKASSALPVPERTEGAKPWLATFNRSLW